jgi:hypothetical protein
MREIAFDGPQPLPGQQLCVMCALRYKAEFLALEDVGEQIQQLMRGPEGNGPAHISMEKLARGRITAPSTSVALGVCQPLGGIIVPLCWGHLQAVKFSAVAPAGPGDMVGPNGAPLPLIGKR